MGKGSPNTKITRLENIARLKVQINAKNQEKQQLEQELAAMVRCYIHPIRIPKARSRNSDLIEDIIIDRFFYSYTNIILNDSLIKVNLL